MTFEVFHRTDSARRNRGLSITITRRGVLALSPDALRALGEPQWVHLLYDRDARTIGISAAESDGDDSFTVRGTGQVAAAAFCRYYDIPIGETGVRWPAEKHNDILYVDASQPGTPVTSNRARRAAD